ncbi:hypothetical protein ACWCPQ_10390 [Nocardia sp. NPDC001965]
MTRALTRALKDLMRLTRKEADGFAGNTRGAADYTLRDLDAKGHADQRGSHEFDDAGQAPRTPEPGSATPLDSPTVDRAGSAPTHREYSLDAYVRIVEEREGRALSPERRETLRSGCVGLVQDRIGRSGGLPPMRIAFSDRESHGVIADLGKTLAPVEAAEKDVAYWQKQLDLAEKTTRNHGPDWEATDADTGVSRTSTEFMRWARENLETSHDKARATRARIADIDGLAEMADAKSAAKLEGNRRMFDTVSGYTDELNRIFASKPADAAEVANLIRLHPGLGPVHGIERLLPGGKPEDFEAVVTFKDLWSGQSDTAAQEVKFLDGGIRNLGGSDTPDPGRFRPDPETSRVDMSADLNQGRPNSMNFNYSYYDKESDSWWGADQHDHDPNHPMRVKQMSPEYLWADRPEYDTSVFGIEIVNKSH